MSELYKRNVKLEELRDGMVFIFPDRPAGAPVYISTTVKNTRRFKRIWTDGSSDITGLKWLIGGREIIVIHESK